MFHRRACLPLLFCCLALSSAEERFGVPVYGAARFDADTSALVEKMATKGAACFRSADSLAKVTEFYRKLPGASVVRADGKGAMVKIKGITVTLQNPFRDMKTGAVCTETLISIVRN